tara:strand:- start:1241 stop:1474 length:234 start_codon:yes stop_codon:yes gene_type:complete
MKNFVLSIILLLGLNACSVPLVSSLTSSGITGATTGKYQQSLANSAFDMLVHHNTGHTPTELLLNKLKSKKKPAPHS